MCGFDWSSVSSKPLGCRNPPLSGGFGRKTQCNQIASGVKQAEFSPRSASVQMYHGRLVPSQVDLQSTAAHRPSSLLPLTMPRIERHQNAFLSEQAIKQRLKILQCLPQPTLRIQGHRDDVNAVAWADDSGNLLLSGSDDRLCKVRLSFWFLMSSHIPSTCG